MILILIKNKGGLNIKYKKLLLLILRLKNS